ncbi:MAG: AAA family ATPase [Clostridia bacterium]|nr:AAA family ATPase [Clostridia bacterium]
MRARGIFILGLNGCGKTTLGRALAERLGRLRLDVEDYYFPDMTVPYAHPRSRDAVCRLMIEDISTHGDFVLSSVDADLTCELRKLCRLAVWLRAPRELRLARIERREIERFGSRVLPGGDMYERQQHFHAFAAGRDEDMVRKSIAEMVCPVLELDGSCPIEENVERILDACSRLGLY